MVKDDAEFDGPDAQSRDAAPHEHGMVARGRPIFAWLGETAGSIVLTAAGLLLASWSVSAWLGWAMNGPVPHLVIGALTLVTVVGVVQFGLNRHVDRLADLMAADGAGPNNDTIPSDLAGKPIARALAAQRHRLSQFDSQISEGKRNIQALEAELSQVKQRHEVEKQDLIAQLDQANEKIAATTRTEEATRAGVMLWAQAARNGTLQQEIAADGQVNDLLDALHLAGSGLEDELSGVTRILQQLAEGEFDVRLPEDAEGSFLELRRAVNLTATRLETAFADLHHNAAEVLSETSDLSASAEELSKRTERTAGSLAETTGALEQITGSIAATAELAQGAKGFTESAREDARQSDAIVQEAIESMREIQTASTEISRTLSVINDIAFQTNLLALNAGVEAARAGESGRGFAVVASEVRALAQRASDAAQQIGNLITTSSDQINLGVQRVGRTGDTLVTLGERIDRIWDQVGEIALAAKDQSGAVAEINRALGEIDTATQQNTAMFEEMSTANLSLKGASSQILASIEGFGRAGRHTNPAEASSLSAPEEIDILQGALESEEFGVLTADAEEVRRWDMAISGNGALRADTGT